MIIYYLELLDWKAWILLISYDRLEPIYSCAASSYHFHSIPCKVKCVAYLDHFSDLISNYNSISDSLMSLSLYLWRGQGQLVTPLSSVNPGLRLDINMSDMKEIDFAIPSPARADCDEDLGQCCCILLTIQLTGRPIQGYNTSHHHHKWLEIINL